MDMPKAQPTTTKNLQNSWPRKTHEYEAAYIKDGFATAGCCFSIFHIRTVRFFLWSAKEEFTIMLMLFEAPMQIKARDPLLYQGAQSLTFL